MAAAARRERRARFVRAPAPPDHGQAGDSRMRIELRVNGEAIAADVEDRMTLGDFLRERLHLTGTHLACEHGVCGACTVLLDDEPVRSCITLAAAVDGRQVRTIEGFEDDRAMQVIRECFSEAHGLQCGYCTPGMVITVRDLIKRGRC